VPYPGNQAVDGPQNGLAPAPWDVAVSPTTMFVDETKLAYVPHTSQVGPCGQCYARGGEVYRVWWCRI